MSGSVFFRRLRIILVAALMALAAVGCSSMYSEMENWAVAEIDSPEFFAEYDVFYLYPSHRIATEGQYLNWLIEGVHDEIRNSVSRPLSKQFGPRGRLFSPFIPQLSFETYDELLKTAAAKDGTIDWSATPLSVPIKYATEALDYYMKWKSAEQPLVLLGHGQGAVILYEAMKRCTDVKPENGFVVAYLFGIPGITPEKIVRDFGRRGIKPAASRYDVGVMAICNVLVPGEPLEKTFAFHGGAAINPLNWCVDATPAPPKEHPGALFYDPAEPNPSRRVRVRPAFCGAELDPENALIRLTHMETWVNRTHLTRTPDTQLGWVFGMCVGRNAHERVRMHIFLRKGIHLPDDD